MQPTLTRGANTISAEFCLPTSLAPSIWFTLVTTELMLYAYTFEKLQSHWTFICTPLRLVVLCEPEGCSLLLKTCKNQGSALWKMSSDSEPINNILRGCS